MHVLVLNYVEEGVSVNKEFIISKILHFIDKGVKIPKWEDLNLTIDEMAEIVHQIQESGLIKKASVIRCGAEGEIKSIFLHCAELTEKGLEYLNLINIG